MPSNIYEMDEDPPSLKTTDPPKEKCIKYCPCSILSCFAYNCFYWGVGAEFSSLIKKIDISTEYYFPTRSYGNEKFPIYSYDFGATGFVGGGRTL